MPLRAAKTKTKTGRTRAPAKLRTLQWDLRRSSGLQILEASPLKQFDWLVHGFSTRVGGASILPSQATRESRSEKALNLGFAEWDVSRRIEENRRRFVKAVTHRQMPLITLRQIHSDAVRVVATPSDQPQQGDALTTSTPGLLLAIQTAECIPILLVDPRNRAIAAIHAGWRGTLARIAAKTLGRMQMEFSTRPDEVVAAIGPSIGQCCYEVGPDVVKEYAAKFPEAQNWFEGPFEALASGEDPNPLPWLTMMPPGHQPPPPRCHLDLKAANAAILAEAGVSKQNIVVADFCTSCRADLFFSYRRDKTTGRILSVIGIL